MRHKKLSEKLEEQHQRQLAAAGPYEAHMPEHCPMAAEARVLEERVESLKAALEQANPLTAAADRLGRVNDQKRFESDIRETAARAEAAESKLRNMTEERGWCHERHVAAESKVTELEAKLKGSMAGAANLSDWLSGATARANAAEAEVEKLHHYIDEHCHPQNEDLETRARIAEAEVAALKVQMADQIAAFDKAWVEPKALAAEVARLKAVALFHAEAAVAARDEVVRLREELRSRADTEGYLAGVYGGATEKAKKGRAAAVEMWKHVCDERDALRAKLEKLRRLCDPKRVAMNSFGDLVIRADYITMIIDGEGSDEA